MTLRPPGIHCGFRCEERELRASERDNYITHVVEVWERSENPKVRVVYVGGRPDPLTCSCNLPQCVHRTAALSYLGKITVVESPRTEAEPTPPRAA